MKLRKFHLVARNLLSVSTKSFISKCRVAALLGKYKIATFVTITNATGYLSNPQCNSIDCAPFFASSAGIFLTALSAAQINQILEVKIVISLSLSLFHPNHKDSLMKRTMK